MIPAIMLLIAGVLMRFLALVAQFAGATGGAELCGLFRVLSWMCLAGAVVARGVA